MFEQQRINVERAFWSNTFRLYISNLNYDGTIDDVTDVVVTRRENNEIVPDSNGLVLNEEATHQLMNSLWIAGVRPSKDISSTGQSEALLDHIKSLQGRVDFLQNLVMALLEK